MPSMSKMTWEIAGTVAALMRLSWHGPPLLTTPQASGVLGLALCLPAQTPRRLAVGLGELAAGAAMLADALRAVASWRREDPVVRALTGGRRLLGGHARERGARPGRRSGTVLMPHAVV